MQFIRIFLFGCVILLLGSRIECAYSKIYHLFMVENIKPSAFGFTNNEPITLFDTDELPLQERWDMCNDASKIVNDEGGYILISKHVESGLRRPYAVEMVAADRDPKIMEAFECPTKSPIYLQAAERNTTLVVIIIVGRRDIPIQGTPVNGVYYVRKLVQGIRLVDKSPWLSNFVNLRKGVGSFDTDRIPDVQRIEMCRRARMEVLADRNVVFLENTRTDLKRLYVLQSERDPLLCSIVEAFGCPTVPVIYLEVVRRVEENGARVLWAQVIAEITPRSAPSGVTARLKYRYNLEIVLCITTSTVLKSENFGEIPEEQRLSMCREAFQEIHQTEGRNVEFLEDSKPGNSEYYRVLFNSEGKREDALLAFKCPTKPHVFLAVTDRVIDDERQVWIFMEETEYVFSQLGIVGYRFEMVTRMIQVTLAALREKSPSTVVHYSVVGPDCSFPELCRRLCEQIVPYVQNHAKIDVEFSVEDQIGPSGYYVLETDSQQSRPNESGSDGLIAVQAFRCPTYPEIYLNIRTVAGSGNIMWVYTREEKRAPVLNVLHFETAGIFVTISEVSDPESSGKPVRMSAVNTDLLPEGERRQLCRSAKVYAPSKPNVQYFEDTDTGKLKIYTLDRESDDGRILRSYVQAFECPTVPALYLHIRDQDGGHVVWIMEKIVPSSPPPAGETLPPIEFLSYDVRLVKDIIEVKSEQASVNIEEISSRLGYMTLDTNTFPVPYRRLLCEKAVQIISRGNVDVLPHGEPGPSILFHVLEFRKMNYEPPVKAFQCHTDPPLYLQVKKEPGIEACSVVIFAKKTNLIDVRSEFQYIVKFVETIDEVALPPSLELGSIESSAVDIDLFTRKQRLRMCEEALKRLLPADLNTVEIIRGDIMAPQKFYSLSLRSRDVNLESHTVQAFQCPAAGLEVYLEVHFWQSQGFVAWIIAKKIEVARLTTELRQPPRQPSRPREPIVEPPSRPSRESIVMEPPSDTRRPIYSAGTSSDRGIKSYKVKIVEDIYAAASHEIRSILSSPRARFMVNTDEQYSEEQRLQMCIHVAQVIIQEQNVQLLKGSTGRSGFFDVDEGFVVDNIPEIKCVRAFECPTKPPVFVEVRFRTYKGTTVTAIMKELKPLKYSMSLMLKPVDSIKPATIAHVNSSSRQSTRTPSIKGKRPTIANEFSADKLLRVCKRAWKMVSDRELQLSSRDLVNVSGEYVIDSDSPYSEEVHAFKCPTKPPIYLEIHRRVPGEYSVLIIKEQRETNLVRSVFSKRENIKYRKKRVKNITKAPPYRIREILELMPHLEESNMDDTYDEVDRTVMCRDAMNMIPEIKFKFLWNERRDIKRTYILNAESQSQEFVKAFKCPTFPELHIQLEESEAGVGYTAWMIIVESGPPSTSVTRDHRVPERGPYSSGLSVPRTTEEDYSSSSRYYSDRPVATHGGERIPHLYEPRNSADGAGPSSSYQPWASGEEDRAFYDYPPPELQVVEKIAVADPRVIATSNPNDLPPPEPVVYDVELRDRMCEEGRSVVPGKEFIGRLENRCPREYELYEIYYRSEVGALRNVIVSAFVCPYEPPFMIQTYDKILGRRVTRVIIMEAMLPAEGSVPYK